MAKTMGRWLVPVLLGTALAGQAVCATAPAALQISTETAPAGGWAQIKIYAAKPVAIASGHLVLNLDATAFGTGAMVGLFGANGDAAGLAAVTGPQIDVQFSSATGGIGQLAGLPVMVISVPVLASAAGRTVAVSATSPDSSVSVASGSVTVRGTLWVERIPAGMGVVPVGTVVPVYGKGFTASTAVTMDGVEIASEKFVAAAEIDVTLGGAAELVGKLARVTDSGVEFDYFCFQTNDPVNASSSRFWSSVANVQPLFPVLAATGFAGSNGYPVSVIEVQNPNPAAATVNLTNIGIYNLPASQTTLTIPPGSWALLDGQADKGFALVSNLPVRVVSIQSCEPSLQPPLCLVTPILSDSLFPGEPGPVLKPSSLEFGWQMGASTVPAARAVSIYPTSNAPGLLAATPASGQAWLSASNPVSATSDSYSTSVSVNPANLTPGTYRASIMVTQSFGPPSATLPVTLTVTSAAVPVISCAPTSVAFTAPAFNATPYSAAISVTSDSGPAAFSVTLQPGTWLKVSPMSGTTPATLSVTWDPAVTSQFSYQFRSTPGSILISGPGNVITIPATFNVTGIQTGPGGLVFSAQTGSPTQTQTIYVDPAGTISAAADQPWMSVVAPAVGAGANQTVLVTVRPTGLAAGVYHGSVTIGEPGLAPIAVPVMLGVWSTAPGLTISTGSFTFVQTVGEPAPAYQTAVVDSGGMPVPFTTLTGANWLNVVYHFTPTPASIQVGVASPPALPGEYVGSFTIQSPGGAVYVPVTLLVEPGPLAPPVLSQVVNAASGIAGGVSPGELLTIRGYGAGAAAVSGMKLDDAGMVAAKLNELQVTFDGKAAPLLYTSANQTNLMVPYEVAGKTSTAMQVVYAAATGTLQSAAWVLPVAAAAPGVFTMDATGTGPGAVVNQDGSLNGAANPAARGSVISIYATGEGQTSPAGVTGSVTQSNTKAPSLPVTVTIGGVGAAVQYAGSAPGEVAGVLQVNAVVPQGIGPGPAVPVTVSVGGTASQAGVTMAVK